MTRRSTAQDPESLDRFVAAQGRAYTVALTELEQGRKENHWMWFVLPHQRRECLTERSPEFFQGTF